VLNATTSGTPTIETDKFVIRKSVLFSGAGGQDALIVDNNTSKLKTYINNQSITVSFWCWSISAGDLYGRIFYGTPFGAQTFQIDSFQIVHWLSTNQLVLIINRGETYTLYYITDNMPAFNTEWTHITVVIE